MAEENKTLAESLIPGEKETVGVLAYDVKRYMWFVNRICEVAGENVHDRFFYFERYYQLRGYQCSKVIALNGWTERKSYDELRDIDYILEAYNITPIKINDGEL
jgi:hypothetical protein